MSDRIDGRQSDQVEAVTRLQVLISVSEHLGQTSARDVRFSHDTHSKPVFIPGCRRDVRHELELAASVYEHVNEADLQARPGMLVADRHEGSCGGLFGYATQFGEHTSLYVLVGPASSLSARRDK